MKFGIKLLLLLFKMTMGQFDVQHITHDQLENASDRNSNHSMMCHNSMGLMYKGNQMTP